MTKKLKKGVNEMETKECKHEGVYPSEVFLLNNYCFGIAVIKCGDCDKVIGYDWGEVV